MKRHARITESDLIGFSLLTKNEIRVWVFLKMCMNTRSGRCNPSRRAIAAATGLLLPHISDAINGLERKNLITEDDKKAFVFVTEPVITEPVITEPVITEPVTPGAESVTEITEPVISHNIIEQTIKQTIEQTTNVAEDGDGQLSEKAERVFLYWKKVFRKSDRYTFTKERRNLVIARLKKYSVRDIFDAIDGCSKSRHHSGDNDRATVYDDLELICRNDTKLEKFIGYNEGGRVRRPDVGRPASNPGCSRCGGSNWQREFPAEVDRAAYTADGFPCEFCSPESYQYCLKNYKIAA